MLQGTSDIFCTSCWHGSCLQLSLENSRHIWELVTSSCISSYNPGHYMVYLVLCKHFVSPRCPVWSCLSRSCHFLLGIIILVTFQMRPFSILFLCGSSKFSIGLHFSWYFLYSAWWPSLHNVFKLTEIIILHSDFMKQLNSACYYLQPVGEFMSVYYWELYLVIKWSTSRVS